MSTFLTKGDGQGQNAKKPNVIYILADDMGYGDISYYNEMCPFQTPNYDQLCQEGIRFTDAHSTSAVCIPSRYGILTGRYNWRSRLKYDVLGGYSEPLIEEETKTVAQMFSDYGYRTACVHNRRHTTKKPRGAYLGNCTVFKGRILKIAQMRENLLIF